MQCRSEVAQLCPTICDPMDCSLPGSSAHGILRVRIPQFSECLRLQASTEGGPGSIPRQGPEIHMLCGKAKKQQKYLSW